LTPGGARVVSVAREGGDAARAALEQTIGGGGVAVFPADTLYGLACDPLNAEAIEHIHALKGRDAGKPSAILYFSPLAMRELIAGMGPRTRDAVATLLPGPVTLVIANPDGRYPLACREDPERLGVRLIADSPLAGTMQPLFQTSANLSGEPAPHRFETISPMVLDGADLAIDGGELGGDPSTVVDVTGIEEGEWQVLREGALSAAEVDARLG